MYKFSSPLLLLLIISSELGAQIFPKENSVLNYRIAGFSVPSSPEANKYTLEIAAGNYNAEDSFEKNIIVTIPSNKSRVAAEVPFFGRVYTWRVIYSNDTRKVNSNFHHFSTGTIPEVDTNIFRLRVTDNAVKYKDAFVYVESNKVMYDMSGRPVWYFPWSGGYIPEDLKISHSGTFTFLLNGVPYEMSYDGDTVWKAVKKPSSIQGHFDNCHHEFTKLGNGHYMVLGNKSEDLKQPGSSTDDINSIQKIVVGTIEEYDKDNNLVWWWNSMDYLCEAGIIAKRLTNSSVDVDAHLNSLYFDERNKVIYLSFKNAAQIVKIKYPTGKILNIYNGNSPEHVKIEGSVSFCGQHSIGRSQNKCLYLYNNNTCDSSSFPKIIMMKEPGSKTGDLQKTWEYECAGNDTRKKTAREKAKGGKIVELPDESLFVSMGGAYGKLFIISKDKTLLWTAVAEQWNADKNGWISPVIYRSSIIADRANMLRLVWGKGLHD